MTEKTEIMTSNSSKENIQEVAVGPQSPPPRNSSKENIQEVAEGPQSPRRRPPPPRRSPPPPPTRFLFNK